MRPKNDHGNEIMEQQHCMLWGAGGLACGPKAPERRTYIGILGEPRMLVMCEVHYAHIDKMTDPEGRSSSPSVLGLAGEAQAHTQPVAHPTHLLLPWGEEVPWNQVWDELAAADVLGNRRRHGKMPNDLMYAFVQIRAARLREASAARAAGTSS